MLLHSLHCTTFQRTPFPYTRRNLSIETFSYIYARCCRRSAGNSIATYHGVVWDGEVQGHKEGQVVEARPSREALCGDRRQLRARIRYCAGAGQAGGKSHACLPQCRAGGESDRKAPSRSSGESHQGGTATPSSASQNCHRQHFAHFALPTPPYLLAWCNMRSRLI